MSPRHPCGIRQMRIHLSLRGRCSLPQFQLPLILFHPSPAWDFCHSLPTPAVFDLNSIVQLRRRRWVYRREYVDTYSKASFTLMGIVMDVINFPCKFSDRKGRNSPIPNEVTVVAAHGILLPFSSFRVYRYCGSPLLHPVQARRLQKWNAHRMRPVSLRLWRSCGCSAELPVSTRISKLTGNVLIRAMIGV